MTTNPTRELGPPQSLDESGSNGSSWAELTVLTARTSPESDPPVNVRAIVLRVVAAAAVVLVIVAVVGLFASRRIAERQAVNDAAQRTDLLVESTIQPAIDNGLADGNASSVRAFDTLIKKHVLGDSIMRVKVWSPGGRIVYSDEARLIGQSFALDDDELAAFNTPKTQAGVTDLHRPENRYESTFGKSLEVYRPVWTPSGEPLLFETYSQYSTVSGRTGQLWRGFAGITISSLILLIVLLTPVLLTLLRRLRNAQRQRELLLEQSVRASSEERRRIAATLHDGVVQDLAATSFALSGQAENAAAQGDPAMAETLRAASSAVRSNIGSLRTLLVDIYPPNLSSTGLDTAIADLTGSVRARGIAVELRLEPHAADGLDEQTTQLLFQTTQECLRNVVKHSGARTVTIELRKEVDIRVLDITDDGVGFDVQQPLLDPPPGHFGLRLLIDRAGAAGAGLRVASSPGHGTRWQLAVAAP